MVYGFMVRQMRLISTCSSTAKDAAGVVVTGSDKRDDRFGPDGGLGYLQNYYRSTTNSVFKYNIFQGTSCLVTKWATFEGRSQKRMPSGNVLLNFYIDGSMKKKLCFKLNGGKADSFEMSADDWDKFNPEGRLDGQIELAQAGSSKYLTKHEFDVNVGLAKFYDQGSREVVDPLHQYWFARYN